MKYFFFVFILFLSTAVKSQDSTSTPKRYVIIQHVEFDDMFGDGGNWGIHTYIEDRADTRTNYNGGLSWNTSQYYNKVYSSDVTTHDKLSLETLVLKQRRIARTALKTIIELNYEGQ